MKKRNFKKTGIGLSILLSAAPLLILQLSGRWRVTASRSDNPMSEGAQSLTGFQLVDHGQACPWAQSAADARNPTVFAYRGPKAGSARDAHATFLSSRVTAEHPPVKIVEKRDDHTRIWEMVREVERRIPMAA